ncbi:MAG: hypothetical protein ACI840_000432 [Ulvibacter sp.]|jgi:hypothetical protein
MNNLLEIATKIDNGSTSVGGWKGSARKVASSARSSMSTFAKRTATFGGSADLGGHASNAVGVAGLAGLTLGAAVSTGGGIIALIGIIKLVHSTSSNREARHDTLDSYVPSCVSNRQPQNVDAKAREAAVYLVDEGKNQIGQRKSKLEEKCKAMDTFIAKYNVKTKEILRANDLNTFNIKREEREKLMDAAIKPDGKIFELVRRLKHNANYLYAYKIIGMVINDEQGALQPTAEVTRFRRTFASVSNGIKKDDESIEALGNKLVSEPAPTAGDFANNPSAARGHGGHGAARGQGLHDGSVGRHGAGAAGGQGGHGAAGAQGGAAGQKRVVRIHPDPTKRS